MTKEIEFLETISTLVWNGISKQELVEMLEERKKALKKQLPIHVVSDSQRLKAYDIGYKDGYGDACIKKPMRKDLGVY